MKKRFIVGSLLSSLFLAGGITGMVSAQSAEKMTALTEKQAIEIALREVPGEVLEVELEDTPTQAFYEVEILAENGTEIEVKVAATTGDLLKVEADDEGCDNDHGNQDA